MNRFWSKVDKGDDGEWGSCWLWTARTNHFGYGEFWFRKTIHKAHRVAWILVNGEIPDGLCVLHRCDNPSCVNPEHLWLGTKCDNNRDKAEKGRAPTMTPERARELQQRCVIARQENDTYRVKHKRNRPEGEQ